MGNEHNLAASFASSDLDESRFYLSKLFKPHQLKVSGRNQVLDVAAECTDLDGLAFIKLRHGATVDIDPERLDDFFNLQIPIRGSGHVRIKNSNLDISSKNACMISPTFDVSMQFKRDCSHIILKIERSRLETFLERQIQRELVKPLEFSPWVDLSSPQNAQLLALIVSLGKQVADEDSLLEHKMIRDQVTSLLMSTLLVALDHNYKCELKNDSRAAVPYYVKRARDYIHANATSAIVPEVIAEEAGVSIRSIYSGFRKYYSLTPMEYLKSLRLSLANQKLRDFRPSETSVTNVALEFGFSHFGNFAADYKRKYGELPSETLRKANLHS